MAETTKATSKGLKAAFKGVPTPVLIAVPVVAGLAFYLWNKKKAASATAAVANAATTGSTTTGTTSTGTSYSTDGGYGAGGGQFGYPDNLGSVLQNLQGQIQTLQNTTGNPATTSTTPSQGTSVGTGSPATITPGTIVGTATGTQTNTGGTGTITPQPTATNSTAVTGSVAPAAINPNTLPTNITSNAQELAALQNQQAFGANQALISAQQKAQLAQLVNNSPLPGLIPIPAGTSGGTSSPVLDSAKTIARAQGTGSGF